MRLAVISDIHGNAVALDAVLADLARSNIDRVVCLGDCIQGGAQPAETVARLGSLGCPTVMGNADAWLLTGEGNEPKSAELTDVRQWSLTKLSAADREFIAGFTPTVALDVGGRAFLGYHGSPTSFDDILMPDAPVADFERLLGPHAVPFMAGGHVHVQYARHFGPSTHFNPGSIGLAFRWSTVKDVPLILRRAEYAVLEVDGDRMSLDFRRVPYDVEAWFQALRTSGRPHAEKLIEQYEK